MIGKISRFWARVSPRRVAAALVLGGPLLLMLALGLTPGISFLEDLGRHLLLGKIILEQRAVPTTNWLTYTNPDFPFVNHHWLSEVLFYLLHRVGGLNGLILFKALLIVLALWFALRTLRPVGSSPVYWLGGVLAAVVLGFRAHIRPEIFTFLGVALMGWGIEQLRHGRNWVRWPLLVYMWFWANSHIYFIFGIGMAGAFVLERWWWRWRAGTGSGRQFPWRDALWCLGLLLVCCLNPNGLKGLLYPFGIFSNYGMEITENASPLEYWRTVLNPMLLALPLLSALLLDSLLAVTLLRRVEQYDTPPRLANYLVALVALAAAWNMARSVPLLALAALPVIGEMEAAARPPRRGTAAARAIGLGVMLLLNLGLLHGVVQGWYSRIFPSPIGPTPFGFDREDRYLALRRLAADGLPGPVFSDYNIGSLVEYNLYPMPGYVDNRPEAFPETFWQQEYLPALALGGVWREVCAARGIQTVAVSLPGVKEPFIQEMQRRPEWVLVHLDYICAVWVLDTPANQPFIARHRIDRAQLGRQAQALEERVAQLPGQSFWRRQVLADQAVYEIYSLVCVGEVAAAWPALWQLHRLYPDYQLVHELLRVSAPKEKVPQVMDVMKRRARWPLAAKQVLDWGGVLQYEGRLDEARLVYQRGRMFFPLSPGVREQARKLEGEPAPLELPAPH